MKRKLSKPLLDVLICGAGASGKGTMGTKGTKGRSMGGPQGCYVRAYFMHTRSSLVCQCTVGRGKVWYRASVDATVQFGLHQNFVDTLSD